MRTLVCNVELIERDLAQKVTGPQERMLFFVKNSADRLRNMIAGLLDYSRLAQDDEAVSEADCSQVMSAVSESLHALIDETSADISFGRLPVVAVSESRVVQLFQNLVGNSLKFRSKNVKPQVNISVERAGAFWLSLWPITGSVSTWLMRSGFLASFGGCIIARWKAPVSGFRCASEL